MVVGIITARGGSKGIRGKNMIDLCGKPLLSYTLQTASNCLAIDKIYLSTDMDSAIDLAINYPKIIVPFKRSKKLSTDKSTQFDVVENVLNYIEKNENFQPLHIVLLQPTSPFRKTNEIDVAIELIKKDKFSSLIGVTEAMHHPAEYLYKDPGNNKRIINVMNSIKWKQRQDYPTVYFNTGALYICELKFLREQKKFYNDESYLFKMSPESMIDIDSEFDLMLARSLAKELCF